MSSLRYYIRRLRELPFPVVLKLFADIVGRKLYALVQKASARIIGTELRDDRFLRTAWAEPYHFDDARSLRSYFRERTSPALFIDSLHPDSVGSFLANNHPKTADALIADAENACDHVFDLLGSGDVRLGETIDWHSDFKTGYRWDPGTYFKDIKIPYGKADIKVPWELSRFSHAAVLGQAYCLTKDEKYPREFVCQVSSWIDANRLQFGVNWACTMDVAIRVCNWIAGYAFFKDSPALTEDFLLKFLKSLYQHGRHIRENLEYSDTLTSNHYLANLAGLVYLGVLFPEFREAEGWKDFSIREMVNEMEKQVYHDGCDFEASTCYHRLVLELFFYPTVVSVLNNEEFNGNNHRDIALKLFGPRYTNRLFQMFEAVLVLLKPSGSMPQIGDNDSGRLHVFAERSILDMRYLLGLGAVFFKERRLKIKDFCTTPEITWVFGAKGFATWQSLEEQHLPSIASLALPDAGWYIMRNDQDYLIVSCGPNGQNGNGGHAHNDKLSFELCIDGQDIFVDAGTGVYTLEPALRNNFRSTAHHNTVIVNNWEQNRFDTTPPGLFRMDNQAKARVLAWESTPDVDRFIGEHAGYDAQGYHHQREILFNKRERSFRIVDSIAGQTPSSTAHFHVAPGIAVHKTGTDCVIAGPMVLSFQCHDKVNIEPYLFSRGYGYREPGNCVTVHFGNQLKTGIVWKGRPD